MTETTLTLGETAWIGEGPKWRDTIPTVFALSGQTIPIERSIKLAEYDADYLANCWRGMCAWDIWREMQEGAGPVPSCAHDWQLDEIQWLVKTTPQKHNQTCRLCGEKRFL